MGLPSWTDHAAGSSWCSWVNKAIPPSRVIKTLHTLRTPGLCEYTPTLGDTRTLSTPGLSGHQDSLATRTVWVHPDSWGHQDSEYTRTLWPPGLLGDQGAEDTRTLSLQGLETLQNSQGFFVISISCQWLTQDFALTLLKSVHREYGAFRIIGVHKIASGDDLWVHGEDPKTRETNWGYLS